jgi:hypothetical protein
MIISSSPRSPLLAETTRKGGMNYDVTIIWWLEPEGSDKLTRCDRSYLVSMQQFVES